MVVTTAEEATRMEDPRFDLPLYTLAEAARALGVPWTTFQNWARGYTHRADGRATTIGEPVVTAFASKGGEPSIPFIGLAEGVALAAIRRQGVPLQRIRPALLVLQRELGVEHALASKKLYTDGAEVLFDYAAAQGDSSARELVVLRNGQRVFTEVVESYLKRITFASDGWAERIRLPHYDHAEIIADPRFSFGQPTFLHGRARLADVLELFWSGEDMVTVAREYGISVEDVEDAVRVASRPAA
jgi:uncharacterized protein (DUF433 family)